MAILFYIIGALSSWHCCVGTAALGCPAGEAPPTLSNIRIATEDHGQAALARTAGGGCPCVEKASGRSAVVSVGAGWGTHQTLRPIRSIRGRGRRDFRPAPYRAPSLSPAQFVCL